MLWKWVVDPGVLWVRMDCCARMQLGAHHRGMHRGKLPNVKDG